MMCFEGAFWLVLGLEVDPLNLEALTMILVNFSKLRIDGSFQNSLLFQTDCYSDPEPPGLPYNFIFLPFINFSF